LRLERLERLERLASGGVIEIVILLRYCVKGDCSRGTTSTGDDHE
jgi:hypothetical protein